MSKVNVPITNDYCPQPLFLYGTYREDGQPNFALFCWFSYCFDNELEVMCCVGDPKLTQDRIRETGVFSANLVTRDLLPLADYCGHSSGRQDKLSGLSPKVGKGAMLNVPVLEDSPLCYELEVDRTISLCPESDLYLCRIRNVLAEQSLVDVPAEGTAEALHRVDPVITTRYAYFATGEELGKWGDWAARI